MARDNTVSFGQLKLQLPQSRLRPHYVKARVRVHQYPDGSLAVFHGPRAIARYPPMGNRPKSRRRSSRLPRNPLRRGLKPGGFVDSRSRAAHKLHKAKISKPKRTNDVLPKPVKSKCYRHMLVPQDRRLD